MWNFNFFMSKNENFSLSMAIIIFHEKNSLFDMKPLKIDFDLLINLRQPRALEVKYQARILHLKFSKIFTVLKTRSAGTSEIVIAQRVIRKSETTRKIMHSGAPGCPRSN